MFISVRDEDKPAILPLARRLAELQFEIHSTGGTADFLGRQGLQVRRINKVSEGSPHCVDAIREGKFSFVINTTADEMAVVDSFTIRRAAPGPGRFSRYDTNRQSIPALLALR